MDGIFGDLAVLSGSKVAPSRDRQALEGTKDTQSNGHGKMTMVSMVC